jgi:membrane dipeptidase
MVSAAAGTLLHSVTFAQETKGVSQAAADLYQRALVLDCNSGPAGSTGDLPIAQSALDMMRSSGVSVIKLTMGGINSGFSDTVEEIAYFQRMIEVHPSYFLQVRVPADIERAKGEGRLGIIFSFESVEMLEGKVDRIETFRDLGVRVMQLSYNRKSTFGAGVMEPEGGGLTALGRQAVSKMNAVGVAVDLSHSNPQTTADAISASTKPVLVSHAGCAAVHAHPRNKTDDQLVRSRRRAEFWGSTICRTSRRRPSNRPSTTTWHTWSTR